jgi:predicted amidohydrolase
MTAAAKPALKVAIGQFAVAKVWEENLRTCLDLLDRADAAGAKLLVLPEGILARDIADPKIVLKSAQPLDGPFVSTLAAATRARAISVMLTVHVPASEGRVFNVFVVLRKGEIVAQYRKLHLYDAFSMKESTNVQPGDEVPPLVEIDGLKFGLMTCYDVRFPELARRLADDGAEVLVLPAAWVKGPLKEHHWETLVTARALENTCYMIAAGECGERNIGASLVIDPLGVAVARAGEAPVLLFAELDPARIAHARDVLPALANRRFARPELATPAPGNAKQAAE